MWWVQCRQNGTRNWTLCKSTCVKRFNDKTMWWSLNLVFSFFPQQILLFQNSRFTRLCFQVLEDSSAHLDRGLGVSVSDLSLTAIVRVAQEENLQTSFEVGIVDKQSVIITSKQLNLLSAILLLSFTCKCLIKEINSSQAKRKCCIFWLILKDRLL